MESYGVRLRILNSTQDFYAAEAGMAQLTAKLYNEQFEDIEATALEKQTTRLI